MTTALAFLADQNNVTRSPGATATESDVKNSMRGSLGPNARVGVGASGAGVRVGPKSGVGVAPPNGVGRGVLVAVIITLGVSVGSIVNVGMRVGGSVGIICAVVAAHPLNIQPINNPVIRLMVGNRLIASHFVHLTHIVAKNDELASKHFTHNRLQSLKSGLTISSHKGGRLIKKVL